MEVERMTLSPAPRSPLFHDGHPIRIAADRPWGGQARIDWYDITAQVAFVKKFAGRGPFTLVDIGLNAGLFSRMALVALPNDIEHVFGYEPDPGNFHDAVHNLLPWADKLTLHCVALGEAYRDFYLYREVGNSGNYSRYLSCMRDLPHDVISARMWSIQGEASAWLDRDQPIFYKSDVHKPKVLDFCAVIEHYAFMRLLEADEAISVDGVMAWLARPDYGSDDLAVWR
jgi:hypothetical protein